MLYKRVRGRTANAGPGIGMDKVLGIKAAIVEDGIAASMFPK